MYFKAWMRVLSKPVIMGGLGALIGLMACILVLDKLFPPPLARAETGIIVTDQDRQWLHGFPAQIAQEDNRWRLPTRLEEIDPVFRDRLIAVEDKRFYDHRGVDFVAVLRASFSLIRSGEIVSGASTITMQTARLLEPRPRTFRSKFIEMLRAFQIEARLSKDEILTLYLTLAPYGGNIEGVRAASLIYFDKEPNHLTDAQQALLIALPQSPEARRPDLRPDMAREARGRVLQLLEGKGKISTRLAGEAREARLPTSRMRFDRFAWHRSYALKRGKLGGEHQLTLDRSVQVAFEEALQRSANQHKDMPNYAGMIIENKTRHVVASVGSASLDHDGGWIDMTRAIRSPGSTLKPFIYGLAFEDGTATPETLMRDAAKSFDGYKPENFSRVFHGDVSVNDALQHSLNMPAVLALDRIGPDRFVATLSAAGLAARMPIKANRRASLAVALGGVGLSLEDIAMLYTGLANDGVVAPLIWTDIEQGVEPYRILSSQSTRQIAAIMRDAPAPAGRSPSGVSVSAPRVAFKTGTSYGYRDAWAAGFTHQYTVVIWAGHANGTPRPGVTGRTAALPVLFDTFDMLAELLGQDRQRDTIATTIPFQTGRALGNFTDIGEDERPEIIFPENNIEVYLIPSVDKPDQWRSYALSARGETEAYQWYVDGIPIKRIDGRALWVPSGPGYFMISVVNAAGRSARSRIRVIGDEDA